MVLCFGRVPRISEFFGLVVYMYWFDTQRHHQPHFHVRHQGAEGVFALDGTPLDGDLGRRANRLVAEWAEEREAELREAWRRAENGEEIPWILPLR
jgi:hypothetical protein